MHQASEVYLSGSTWLFFSCLLPHRKQFDLTVKMASLSHVHNLLSLLALPIHDILVAIRTEDTLSTKRFNAFSFGKLIFMCRGINRQHSYTHTHTAFIYTHTHTAFIHMHTSTIWNFNVFVKYIINNRWHIYLIQFRSGNRPHYCSCYIYSHETDLWFSNSCAVQRRKFKVNAIALLSQMNISLQRCNHTFTEGSYLIENIYAQ